MSNDKILKRLAQLESLLEEQRATIESQRERIAELERQRSAERSNRLIADGTSVKVLGELDATDGTGVLGRVTGSGQTYGVRGEVSSTSGYGLSTPDDATIGGTAELATLGGGVTGGSTVTSLTGDRLSVTDSSLTADITGVSEGGTAVYANADEINFGPGLYVQDDLNGTVTVSTFAPPFSVAFADPSDDTPRRLNVNGTVEDYATSVSANTLGPPTVDLTSDGTLDLPVRDGNGDLTIVDVGGNAQTLANNIELSGIGVGDWNGDGTVEVVYVQNDGSGLSPDLNLYSVAPGRSPTNLGFEPSTGITVADFDGDDSQEIIWGNDDGSNINLVYSGDGSSTTDTGYDVEVELGTPADFDGDGTIEIAASTSSDNIELVEDDGTVTTLSTSYTVSTLSMGALDYTGTGAPDVIHSRGNTSPSDIYYYDVVNDATGPVTDGSGTTLQTTIAGIR